MHAKINFFTTVMCGVVALQLNQVCASTLPLVVLNMGCTIEESEKAAKNTPSTPANLLDGEAAINNLVANSNCALGIEYFFIGNPLLDDSRNRYVVIGRNEGIGWTKTTIYVYTCRQGGCTKIMERWFNKLLTALSVKYSVRERVLEINSENKMIISTNLAP